MKSGKIDISDCRSCRWLGYDPLENMEICMLYDEQPISEITSCDVDGLSYNQELLIIESNRGK